MSTPCPDCSAPLTAGATRCSRCGLPLVGTDAAALWQVDQKLATLADQQRQLLAERARLLNRLRGGAAPTAPGTVAPPVTPPVATPRPAFEWSPQRVQNVLLSLGAVLLAVAAVVFTVVAWSRLGVGGRAAVLLGVTAAAAASARVLLRRRLPATAEALGGLAVALGLVDLLALRRAGLSDVDAVEAHVYWSIGIAALTGLTTLFALAVRLRGSAIAAVALGQLPALIAATGTSDPVDIALWILLIPALDLAVAYVVLHERFALDPVAWGVLLVGGAAGWLGAALPALGAGLADDDQRAVVPLLGLALVGAAAAALAPPHRLPTVAAATGATIAAALVLPWPHVDELRPLLVAALGAAVVGVAAAVPEEWRHGVLVSALGTAAVGGIAVADRIVLGVTAPYAWLVEVWASDGPDLLPADVAWDRGRAVTAVVGVVAVAVAAALATLGRRREAAAALGLGAVVAAWLLPFDLDLDLVGAVVLSTGLAAVLLAATALQRLPAAAATAMAAAGVFSGARAVAWALADETLTLLALPALAVAAAVGATRPRLAAPLTATAALLAAGEAAAACYAADFGDARTGAVLATVAVLLVLAAELPTRPLAPAAGLHPAAAVVGGVGLVLASADPGWLSWVLAGYGLLGLAVAARRPSRRPAALPGAVLLAASSWVRLADAGVDEPEPYTLPLALFALLAGWYGRRTDPSTGSFAAYGPGLTGSLLPSLLFALDREELLRPMLLGGAALVVVLAGARFRLRAPIAFGGGTLLLLAVDQVAPYVGGLPRWVGPAVAGALLVMVGATYEQRRRDLNRLRESYMRLA